MTDLFEQLLERAPRDATSGLAETLVPMLDDLARAFGCDRGIIAVYDESHRSLRGVSGHGVPTQLVDSMDVRLDGAAPAIEAALATGSPQRIDDLDHDSRLAETVRQLLLEAGFERTVLVPVSGPSGPIAIVVLSRRSPFSKQELQGLLAVTNRARDVIARARDAADLRDTGEAHAIEKEWLWWMVNAVDDPAIVTDENNEIILRNVRAELLFKAHDDDSQGRRHAVWMNNFLFTAALSSWKLEPSGRSTIGREVTLVDPIEGSEVVYEVIARPATNYRDGSRGIVAVLKDVTQLRHVNEELARGREQLQSAGEAVRVERDRLELILRSVPNPIVVLGSEDEPITMNNAAIRLFGAERDRPIPVSDRRRQIVLGNETRLTSFISQMRLEPGERKAGELALSDPDTEDPLEMAVTATEIRDPRGAVVGVVAVLQDIGRLRELERRRVEQVLFDSEKLAATGRLAASIAHELNNPLEAIQNSLYVLVENTPEDDPHRGFLEIARKETGRMSRILREMLGFYRPALEMAPTDVAALIGDAEALLAKRLRDRKIVIDKRFDSHVPPIRASADQLKQVLLNLFLNAADAMPEGGTVTVTTTLVGGAKIGIPASRSVQIQVRDTGLGIRDEDLAHVFEPFFSTKGGRSSGLGLWVSSGIIQAHGGALQVRSVLGRGTTFSIVLPVDGPPPPEATP